MCAAWASAAGESRDDVEEDDDCGNVTLCSSVNILRQRERVVISCWREGRVEKGGDPCLLCLSPSFISPAFRCSPSRPQNFGSLERG